MPCVPLWHLLLSDENYLDEKSRTCVRRLFIFFFFL